jgi:hypothetical protein
MTAPLRTDEQIASGPLNTKEEVRAKCIEAAEMIIAKHAPGGFWHWLGNERIRVYKANGESMLTLEIEALQ